MSLPGFHQQQQAAHLAGGRDFEGGNRSFAGVGDGGELAFVALAALFIAEQLRAGLQQFSPRLQRVDRESLIRRTIQPLLQGAQHGFAVGGGGDTEKAEVIDRQFQSARFSWA